MRTQERDTNLDIFRGFVMVYIICVVHLLYWIEISLPSLKCMCLFEMPLVFFISGAAHTLSKRRGIKNYVLGRINRVVFPYYGFLLFLFFISIVLFYQCGDTIDYISYLKAFFFIGGGNGLGPYSVIKTSHLWFVSTYLFVSIIVPLVYKLIKVEITSRTYCIILVSVCFIVVGLNGVHHKSFLNHFATLICYMAFYIMGFQYKRVNSLIRMLLAVICFGILFFSLQIGLDMNMYNNKYPVTLIFMVYGLMWICILSLIYQPILILYHKSNLVKKILDIYNTQGYSLYLYQPISYAIIASPLLYMSGKINKYVLILFSFIFLIFFNYTLGLLIKRVRLSKYFTL